MIKISAIQPINNAISSGYPFVEAILSVLPIVDEVLINDGGSLDETPFYLKKLKKTFPEKIKIFNKPFYISDFWETIDDCLEFLISQAKGEWIFEVQGDEVWHEKYIFKLKKIINKASKQEYNSIRTVVHWCTFQNIDQYKYRNMRIVRKFDGLKSHWGGDDFQIGNNKSPAEGFTASNVPPELITNIPCFNLSNTPFPKNALKRAERIATFFARKDKERQEQWKYLQSSASFPKQKPNPRVVKKLPALIQGIVGLDEYKVRKELFDKKFLKRLTRIEYK